MWANGMEKKAIKKEAVKKTASTRKYDERLLNPKGFGGFDSRGREVESKYDMFNSKGEMNAYDKKEVLDNQIKFAKLREKYQKSADHSTFFNSEEKQRLVESVMTGSTEDRYKFAAEMIPLILERLDYEGFIRQVFKTHEVAYGQIISYEKDINVTALVIQNDGQTIAQVVQGDRVFPPEFWVTAYPKINVHEIAQRQFDIVERAHDKAVFQIMLQEDRNGLAELWQAATLENNMINITSTVDKNILESLQHEVERHRLQVDKFIINRAELGDLKKAINAMEFDPLTSRDVLTTGVFASIWGVNIFVSAGVDEPGKQNVSVPPGVVFAVTEGRTLGAMPIRIGLTMYPADQFMFGNFQYGYLFGELIGMTVVNPRAVAVGVKSSAVIPSWLG